MKQMKRLLSLVLTVVMIVVLVPTSANAASTFDQRVSDLRKKFPNNAYWNHAVYNDSQRADVLLANWDNSYGDYTTSTPCATHNGQPGYGQCDCNVFDGGMQCWGFANRIFYGIFGVYASNVSQRWDTQNVQKGDWIRLENENHSAVVLSRNGDYLTIVEGNRDGNCRIVWDRQIHISTINWFKHAPNYNDIVGPHVHSYTTFVYFWKAHPHYNCYQCSCGEVMENRSEVAYVEETIPGKKATCTASGLTDGAKCSICGVITKEQTTIPALGHTEPDALGMCKRCGALIATVTVTYNANGGSVNPTSKSVTAGTAITLPTPTKSYTITYNANGGSNAPAAQSVSIGCKGWATSSTATSASYACGSVYKPVRSLTLYAVWNDSAVTELSASVPTRSGYKFLGWAIDSSATAPGFESGESVSVSGNATLYAVWEKEATEEPATPSNNGSTFLRILRIIFFPFIFLWNILVTVWNLITA